MKSRKHILPFVILMILNGGGKMIKTLKSCSIFAILIGIGMTLYMNFHARDSCLHPGLLLPWALFPYLMFLIPIKMAFSPRLQRDVLFLIVLSNCIAFLLYYDRLFVSSHFTTLQAPFFIEIPFYQFLFSGFVIVSVWYSCRKLKRKQNTQQIVSE